MTKFTTNFADWRFKGPLFAGCAEDQHPHLMIVGRGGEEYATAGLF